MTDKPSAYLASTAVAIERILYSVDASTQSTKDSAGVLSNVAPIWADTTTTDVSEAVAAAIASMLAYMEDRLDLMHDFFVELIETAIADLEERITGLGIPVGETVAELSERVWRIVSVIISDMELLKYNISRQATELLEITKLALESGKDETKGWLETQLEAIDAGFRMGYDFLSDMFKDATTAPFMILFDLFIHFFFEEVEE